MVRRACYVGLSVTVHDPALAIVGPDGEVLFAEATERRHQVKRAWGCVPDDLNEIESLIERHCEEGADLVVARTWSGRMDHLLRGYFLSRPAVDAASRARRLVAKARGEGEGSDLVEVEARWLARGLASSLAQAGSNLAFRQGLGRSVGAGRRVSSRAYDHHLCHAAAGCYASPFDEAVCAVVDGYGESTAAAFFDYRGGRLREIGPRRRLGLPTSLGLFYAMVCRACGFDPYRGEEWKVMGLAAHGSMDRDLYDLLRPMLRVEGLRLVAPPDARARVARILALRPGNVGDPMTARDLAHTGQIVFVEVLTELLRSLRRVTTGRRLVLTGGCALNSAFNGVALDRTGFEELYVPPAPADDGNALGAAWLACFEDGPPPRRARVPLSPYLGSVPSASALARLETFGGPGVRRLQPAEVARVAARLIAEGRIVGWFQGRAELGPRALGNRSVLADPRRPDAQAVLNERVKLREGFRPFAPAVLHEHGDRFFVGYQRSPYMERTFPFRAEVRSLVPGVVHADGTGRVQSVDRESSPRFFELLSELHRLTSVPLVLNTSLNVMGRPIVHSVEDAVGMYLTTGLDALVIGDLLLEKPPTHGDGAAFRPGRTVTAGGRGRRARGSCAER